MILFQVFPNRKPSLMHISPDAEITQLADWVLLRDMVRLDLQELQDQKGESNTGEQQQVDISQQQVDISQKNTKVTHKELKGDLLNSPEHELKKHCEEQRVKKLAIPRIGCGLDRLEWEKVRDLIKEEVQNRNNHYCVCKGIISEKREIGIVKYFTIFQIFYMLSFYDF